VANGKLPAAPGSALAAFMLLTAFTAAAAGPRTPWTGGIVASTRGFSEDSAFLPGEYMDLGLFLDPFQLQAMNPSASLRWVLPLFPFDAHRSLVSLGVELDLVLIRHHPLRVLLAQASAMAPSLGAAWLWNPRLGQFEGGVQLTANLLRLRTGDARYAFLSPELLLDGEFSVSGWGLRLFDFSYFMFQEFRQ
jgi:hypothetical protein